MPLAISQAEACIKNDKNLTIEKYCEIFKKTQYESFEKGIDDKFNYVYTTLFLALHDVRKVNNQVDIITDVIAYMAPEQLDKHLVLSFLESQDPKGLSKTKSKKIKQGFKTFCDYSIILQTNKDENIYSINRLMQSAIRIIH